ncbi:DUF2795 domain-containing protein [Paenarthrobacter sp. Z7-10]|uniref:DUF2795 domain-containing protein n=1 Tax=Paenarthrobacter sp. Z7-10 TaxID=2787635 RepID=UPI0022A9038E|nr:DUF2795 domain-containing protein [Paenarthrobacter sp. Z7-10]MCZ2403149.1 DUF2795 domain-containing protein [Paenarthrobacter sp. Z7-10]
MADKPNPIAVQKALGSVDYPASRNDLVQKAEQSGADDSVLDALRNLPDRQYAKPTEVNEALS